MKAITIRIRKQIIDAFECLDEIFTLNDISMLNLRSWFTKHENWKNICEKVSHGKYKKLQNWKEIVLAAPHTDPVIKGKAAGKIRHDKSISVLKTVLNEMPPEFTTRMLSIKSVSMGFYPFPNYNINRLSAYVGIECISPGFFRKINKEITMPKPKDIISTNRIPALSEAKTEIVYLPRILAEFKALPNSAKLDFIKALIPMLPDNQLSDAYAERYPDYLFKDIKDGDKLFHPIAGDIEITNVSAHKFHFYGNGKDWECDRNGRLIVNGKTNETRSVFIDIDDYVAYMKSLKKKLSGK